MDVPEDELRAVFGSTGAPSITSLYEPVASATGGICACTSVIVARC